MQFVAKLSRKEIAGCSSVAEYMGALHRKTLELSYDADETPAVTLTSDDGPTGRGLASNTSVSKGELIFAERAVVAIDDSGKKADNASQFALVMTKPANNGALKTLLDMQNSFFEDNTDSKNVDKESDSCSEEELRTELIGLVSRRCLPPLAVLRL